MSSQNRKYLMHRDDTRGGPSHGHRQHAQKFDKDLACGSSRTDRQTDTHTDILIRINKNYDDKLLTKASQGNHVMHHLLPSPKSTCYNLRTLGHGLSDNPVKSELYKKTFINTVIF